MTYRQSSCSLVKENNFNRHLTIFSNSLIRLRLEIVQRHFEKDRNLSIFDCKLSKPIYKYLEPLYTDNKRSGTHEHQGEIKDVRFNIEPYSTKRIRLLIPKNNA